MYVVVFYGGVVLVGDVEWWNKVLFKGYGLGDVFGNVIFVLYLFFVVVWVFSGVI